MHEEKLDVEKELADTADNMAQAEAELRKAQLREPKSRTAAMRVHDARERLAEHDHHVREQLEQQLAEDPAAQIPPELAAELLLLESRPGGPGEPEVVHGYRWRALREQENRAELSAQRGRKAVERAEKNLEHAQYLHRWAKLKASVCELSELSADAITWTKTAEGMQALDGQVQLYTRTTGNDVITQRVATVEICGREWHDSAASREHTVEPAYAGAQAAQSAVVGHLQELARKENWPCRLPPDAAGETVLRRHRDKGQPAPFVREVTDPEAKDPTSGRTAPKRPA